MLVFYAKFRQIEDHQMAPKRPRRPSEAQKVKKNELQNQYERERL